MRRAVRAVLLGVSLVLSGSGVSAGTAVAEPPHPVIAGAKDDPDDVTITRADGLEKDDRRSVELKKVAITDRGKRVRFTVRVGRVDRSETFTQIYFIDLITPYLQGQIGVATHSLTDPESQDPHGIHHAIFIAGTEDNFVFCEHLRTSLRDGSRRWWVEVPKRCLPSIRVRLVVKAQTVDGPGQEIDKQYSHDTLKLGRVNLGGEVRPGYEP